MPEPSHLTSVPTSIDDTKARRDQLVESYLNAKANAEKYTDIIDELTEQIAREIPVGCRHEVRPGYGIRVQPPSRVFKADLAHAVLTPEQYLSICELKPSSRLATKMLPGLLVDQCKAAGDKPTVREL